MRHIVLLCTATLAAQTDTVVDRVIATANRTVTYGGIAISPDGERLAWVQGTVGAQPTLLHIARRTGDGNVEITLPGASKSRQDKSPAWAPDSRRLAFLSDTGDHENPDLWLVDPESHAARKLASLKGFADRPRWSPDGSRIAFLYVEGASGGGPLVAAGPQTGVIDTSFHNQRIGIVDVATATVVMGSPADRHVYDFDWSPDSKRFAATAAPGPGDNNWWIAQLYVFDAAAATGQSIYKPKLEIAVPRWSPDGRRIAFIEGLMSDEGVHGGDLHTIPSTEAPPPTTCLDGRPPPARSRGKRPIRCFSASTAAAASISRPSICRAAQSSRAGTATRRRATQAVSRT